MQQALPSPRIAVSETELAAALGISVPFLRKDRRTKRLIPFYKLGDRVLYNLERVREALDSLEEGGIHKKPRSRRSTSSAT